MMTRRSSRTSTCRRGNEAAHPPAPGVRHRRAAGQVRAVLRVPGTGEGVGASVSGIELPRTAGGWKTILADPPWAYENATPRGGVGHEYPTLSIEEICALPVREVAADSSILLLWLTNPMVPEAVRVINAWGFTWKTMRTWCKPRLGVGYWLRGQTEHIAVAVRGRPSLPEIPLPSVFHDRQGSHSTKPASVYPWAESMGESPRLEVFARQRRVGWGTSGNQTSVTAQAGLEGLGEFG